MSKGGPAGQHVRASRVLSRGFRYDKCRLSSEIAGLDLILVIIRRKEQNKNKVPREIPFDVCLRRKISGAGTGAAMRDTVRLFDNVNIRREAAPRVVRERSK